MQTVFIFDIADVWTTSGLLGSIFGFIGLSNKYEKTAVLERFVGQTTFDFPQLSESSYTFNVCFMEPVELRHYTPQDIFSYLGKLGALIALSRIFILFSLYHQYRFEHQLAS